MVGVAKKESIDLDKRSSDALHRCDRLDAKSNTLLIVVRKCEAYVTVRQPQRFESLICIYINENILSQAYPS